MNNPFFNETDRLLYSLPLVSRGKIRYLYEIDSQYYLMLASDNISAFDQILNSTIPGKGRVLTELSAFWFQKMKAIIPNHYTPIDPCSVVSANEYHLVKNRSMIVKRLEPIPLEIIIRGYLCGQAWNAYQKTGTVNDIPMPTGLHSYDQLVEPLFTATTKALPGEHDQVLTYTEIKDIIGTNATQKIQEISIKLYQTAQIHAELCGYVLGDCKFEFGYDNNGNLHLMDEVCTTDCARYWLYEAHRPPQKTPEHLDKQVLRNYLQTIKWTNDPSFQLPISLIEQIVSNNERIYQALTSHST